MVLLRYVGEKTEGFFIDIGAHHPLRFSNTAAFYLNGWRGLNIDADQKLIELFAQYRPLDINVTAGVGSNERVETLYIFNEPALNTFDNKLAQERVDVTEEYKIVEQRRVRIRTLANILNEQLPLGTHIDFMSIDVEGRDYDVLTSNDWNRYRPDYLLVEVSDVHNLLDVEKCKTTRFLKSNGYEPIAKTLLTVVYENVKRHE